MHDYLYYNFKTSQVAKVNEKETTYQTASTITKYLDTRCLQNGSSLQGRKDSFSFLTNQKKFIPIVVSIDPVEIYFPTLAIQDPDCKWINYASIEKIKYKKKTCTFYFKDGACLDCLYPERMKQIMRSIYLYLQSQS